MRPLYQSNASTGVLVVEEYDNFILITKLVIKDLTLQRGQGQNQQGTEINQQGKRYK